MNRHKNNRKLWLTIILLSLALVGTWLSRYRQKEEDYPRDEAPKLDEKGQPVMTNGVAMMVDVPKLDE